MMIIGPNDLISQSLKGFRYRVAALPEKQNQNERTERDSDERAEPETGSNPQQHAKERQQYAGVQ